MTDDDRTQPQRDGDDLTQHPYVSRRRPDPAVPAEPVLFLDGVLGDSDRAGHRRLYFTRGLDWFVEFRDEDVLAVDPITAEHPPFVGEEATRLTLRRDAVVHYTRTRKLRPVDEFDLDVRLSSERKRPGPHPRMPDHSILPDGCPYTPGQEGTLPGGRTEGGEECFQVTDHTCPRDSTCETCPHQNTCGTCAGQGTCATCAGQHTCQQGFCAQQHFTPALSALVC